MVRTQPEGYQHRRRRRAESESARRSEREEKGGERDGSRADGGSDPTMTASRGPRPTLARQTSISGPELSSFGAYIVVISSSPRAPFRFGLLGDLTSPSSPLKLAR